MSRTDAALLLAARTDPGAFRELYERYAEQLQGVPPAPHRRRGRRLRPHRRDVRAGMALARAVPRRGRRIGGAVALRHRPQRAADVGAPSATGALGVRAPGAV